MTEEELYKKANKLYHTKGGELNAIEAYKKLIELHPNNLSAWEDLSTIQYSICDYDASIQSENRMIELDPVNTWNIKNYIVKLNLLQKFTFREPDIYLDENTREAFKISELTGQYSLCDLIQKHTLKLIELEPNKKKENFQYHFSLARTLIKYHKYNQAIPHLNSAFELKEYKIGRIDATPNIYNWKSTAYLGLREYQKALEFMDLAFETGLDEFQMLKKADIYHEQGDTSAYRQTIEDFIKVAERKMKENPESAFVNQKITALLKLKEFKQAENALLDFEILKPFNDYTTKNIERLKGQIEKEKTDNK